MIRPAAASDCEALTRIYNHYVEHTHVTFEETPILPAEMERRVGDVLAASFPWLVLEANGSVVGYAYATKWKHRAAYRFAAECTIYLDPTLTGQGFGSTLYRELLATLARAGIHTVIGGIALPNDPSVALHEKLGMEKVAHFRQVGFKLGKWVDVGYWQRLL